MIEDPLEQPVSYQKTGLHYITFLKQFAGLLQPTSYFEIGTFNGKSVAALDCASVCVDPQFKVEGNIIGRKSFLQLFQMTSDTFFRDFDLKTVFPKGVDIAFLDGMHRAEFLIRDFFHVQKFCRRNSIIILHDCLPTDEKMTARVPTPGRWSGDVWKVLRVVKKYQPETRVYPIDCMPTGLVLCTNLVPDANHLETCYFEILDEIRGRRMDAAELKKLHEEFVPMPADTFLTYSDVTQYFSL